MLNQYHFLEFPGASCQQVDTRLQSGLLLQGFLSLLHHRGTFQEQNVCLLQLLPQHLRHAFDIPAQTRLTHEKNDDLQRPRVTTRGRGSIPRRGLDHKQVLHPEGGEADQEVLHHGQHLPDVLMGLALDNGGGHLELAHGHHVALLSHLTEALR